MKPLHSFAMLAAIAAVGQAFAADAVTTPVGYTSASITPGQFNYLGLTVHQPVLSAGLITASDDESVTAGDTDFVALLGASGSATYILELEDGTIQEIESWTNAGVLNTSDDISASATVGASYKLRKAATVSDIFGADNSFGLTPSADAIPEEADRILVLNASNTFTTVYYYDDGSPDSGWYDAQGDPAGDLVIAYPDGFYIRPLASSPSIDFVVSGEVKTTATSGVLTTGFNYVSVVAPVGLTLADTGLEAYLTTSDDAIPETVDNVLLPNPDGSFRTTYYYDDGSPDSGWYDAQGDPAGDAELSSGILIRNRGTAKAYALNVPESYSSL